MRRIAIIGLGRFGSALAETLSDKGVEVLAIDTDADKVADIKDKVVCAVQLDSTDEAALRAVGIEDMDAAVVAIGDNVEANLLTTALLKKFNLPEIFSRSMTPLQARILKTMDIKRVINLEEEMGQQLAKSLVVQTIEKQIALASGHSYAELKAPRPFVGKTMKETSPRRNYKVNVIAIKKRLPDVDEHGQRTYKEEINDVPQPDDVFDEDDVLLVIGSDENIAALAALK